MWCVLSCAVLVLMWLIVWSVVSAGSKADDAQEQHREYWNH